MLEVQLLIVLLPLVFIYFLMSRFSVDEFLYYHCQRSDYYDYSNLKQIRCDHRPSACGGAAVSLKCPFQFEGDDHPDLCRDPHPLKFSCENNRTVLPLLPSVYHNENSSKQRYFYAEVESIDYGKQSLRVYDPGVQKNNCSTLPVYSFDYDRYFYQGEVGNTSYKYKRYLNVHPNTHVLIFLSCKNPVISKSPPFYIDTASCNITADRFVKDRKAPPSPPNNNYYSYVVVGKNLVASDIQDSCTIHKTAWADVRCLPNNNITGDISFQDIHNLMANGLELRWGPTAAQGRSFSFFCLLMRVIRPVHNYVHNHVDNLGVLLVGARCLIGFTLLLVFLLYKWHRRHLSIYDTIEDFLQKNNSLMPISYSYKEIKAMTNNFKEKLGEGGYGLVYKGKLRSGDMVAVKMLNKSKANGQEFINEVATIGRIHHVHVVRLVGFCVMPSKHALVYDYMSNGSLDKFIFSECSNGHILSWKKANEIAIGIARGIEYLHQGCNMQILHFDIKPHNILLDENFVPKISDFGLAKLYPIQRSIATLTTVRGTLGYMAPELFYKRIGRVSDKTDVYSYGMLLMEMAGRRRNINAHAEHSSQIYFPSWIYDKFDLGKDMEIGDHATDEEKTIASKLIFIALWCIQMTPEDRPSMREVLEMLEGDVKDLKLPPKPLIYPPDSPVIVESSSNNSSDKSTESFSSSVVTLEIEQMDD